MERIREIVGAYLMREQRTKKELAESLGITSRSLHEKLSGNVEFRLSEALNLADIVGCTVDDFREED